MYASAGIAEVWLVDVAGAAIEVHTQQPTADGYATHRAFRRRTAPADRRASGLACR